MEKFSIGNRTVGLGRSMIYVTAFSIAEFSLLYKTQQQQELQACIGIRALRWTRSLEGCLTTIELTNYIVCTVLRVGRSPGWEHQEACEALADPWKDKENPAGGKFWITVLNRQEFYGKQDKRRWEVPFDV